MIKNIEYQIGFLEADIIREFSLLHQKLIDDGSIKYNKAYSSDPVIIFIGCLHSSEDLLYHNYPKALLDPVKKKEMIIREAKIKDRMISSSFATNQSASRYIRKIKDNLSPLLIDYFNLKKRLDIKYELPEIYDKPLPNEYLYF